MLRAAGGRDAHSKYVGSEAVSRRAHEGKAIPIIPDMHTQTRTLRGRIGRRLVASTACDRVIQLGKPYLPLALSLGLHCNSPTCLAHIQHGVMHLQSHKRNLA